jgi:hypothetical protein
MYLQNLSLPLIPSGPESMPRLLPDAIGGATRRPWDAMFSRMSERRDRNAVASIAG